MRNLAVLLYIANNAAAVERWFDVCPESDAVIHAWARTTVRFDAPCKTVKGEVLARIAGKNGWVDPHNAGTYELTSSVGDVVAASHVTGNGKYTDKLQFMFENADGGDDCEVSGCSVSQVARGVHKNHALDHSYRFTSAQVTSVIDRSTNYCNLYNLYCGGNVGCQVAQTDLTAIPLDKKTSLGAGKNKFKCRSGKKREL